MTKEELKAIVREAVTEALTVEILPLSERVRKLVTAGAGAPDLFRAGREEGMRTLRESAIDKVFRGVTTVTEAIRVTGN